MNTLEPTQDPLGKVRLHRTRYDITDVPLSPWRNHSLSLFLIIDLTVFL